MIYYYAWFVVMSDFHVKIYRCKVDQWWLIIDWLQKASFCSISCVNFFTISFNCHFYWTVMNDMIFLSFVDLSNLKHFEISSTACLRLVLLGFDGKFLIWENLFSFQFWNSKKFLFEFEKVSDGLKSYMNFMWSFF